MKTVPLIGDKVNYKLPENPSTVEKILAKNVLKVINTREVNNTSAYGVLVQVKKEFENDYLLHDGNGVGDKYGKANRCFWVTHKSLKKLNKQVDSGIDSQEFA